MSQFQPPQGAARSWFGDLALISFLVVQALDGALTYVGVTMLGQGAEANPILIWLMGLLGEGPALAGAKIVAGSCGIALHLRAVHHVVAFLTALYVTVAILPWARILFF